MSIAFCTIRPQAYVTIFEGRVLCAMHGVDKKRWQQVCGPLASYRPPYAQFVVCFLCMPRFVWNSGVVDWKIMKHVAFLSFCWDHEIISAYYLGIEDYLAEHRDTAVVLFNAYGEHEGLDAGSWALELFSFCDLERYDGFIVQGNRTWPPEQRQQLVNEIRAMGKPVVSINYMLKGAHYVGTDNYQAEYGLVERVLRDKGCRRPAFANGLATSTEATERLKGFRDACTACGVEPVGVYEAGWNPQDGVACALHILKDCENLPDVIFCCNDDAGVALQETLIAHGAKVPEDVLVTGFDNRDIVLKTTPHVTTVDRNYRQVGYTAMETITSLMEGADLPERIICPARYILAESSGHTLDPLYVENWAVGLLTMEEELRKFLILLARMQPALLNAQTLKQIMQDCERFLPEMHSSDMEILINDAYLQCEDLTERVSFGNTMSLYAGVGGRATGICDKEHVYARIPSSELISSKTATDPCIYMILPIRHEASCIGVMLAKGIPTFYRYGLLPAILRLLSGFIDGAHKRDVLERANLRLDQLYVRDQLTGLYNRFGLRRFGTPAYERLLHDCGDAMIVFADIDDMKHINDYYGHEVGDQAIRDAAEVVIRATRDEDAVAVRYGGDEFLIICRNDLVAQLECALVSIKREYDRPYDLSLSFGATEVKANEHLTVEQAIERADTRMYEIKWRRKQAQAKK